MSDIKQFSSKSRPEPTSPEHFVLDSLADLFKRLDSHKNYKPGNNMIEKYDYFIRESDKGRACTFAYQSKQLFFLSDYKDIKDILNKVIESIRQMPGDENFAKE